VEKFRMIAYKFSEVVVLLKAGSAL